MGFSLGGGLVMHAAAHEPHVRRMIAQDILSYFTECYARPLGRRRGAFVTHATQIPSRLGHARQQVLVEIVGRHGRASGQHRGHGHRRSRSRDSGRKHLSHTDEGNQAVLRP
jgi:hypothetical protein